MRDSFSKFLSCKKNGKISSIFILSLLLSQSFSLPLTFADPLPDQYKQIPIAVSITPDNPASNQSVTIDITSFSTNLDNDPITWILNGKKAQSGTGIKELKFTTGKLGSVSTVSILVTTPDGTVTQKDVVIHPSEIDMIWQANSYVPPFYEGKALFAHQGTINIVALPNLVTSDGTKISPTHLVYKWFKDRQAMGDSSGYNRQVLTLNEPLPLDPTIIGVDVSSTDGALTGHGDIVIQSILPKVVFYRNDPLVGIQYENALQNTITLNAKEINITAIPYFFSAQNRDDSQLNYSWSLNSTPVPNQISSSVIFRSNDNSQGISSISLDVSNNQKVFQLNSADLSIMFGQNTQSSNSSNNPFPF
jgi:hypothetical protein